MIECIQEKISPEKKPNGKNHKAMNDAKKGKSVKDKDLSDLYEKLGI